jgi:hypothetical protein
MVKTTRYRGAAVHLAGHVVAAWAAQLDGGRFRVMNYGIEK